MGTLNFRFSVGKIFIETPETLNEEAFVMAAAAYNWCMFLRKNH